MAFPEIEASGSGGERTRGSWAKSGLGYLLAAAGLVWVFHGIRFGGLLQSIAAVRWGWVVVAVLCDIASYVCQGLRWSLLLRPLGRLSVLQTTRAIYAGLFTNEILPMRFGELVRAYLVSRWVSAEFVSVVPSMLVERLFDAVWVALGIGCAAAFVRLPKNLLEAGDVLGFLVVGGTALFVYAVFRRQKTAAQASPASGWKFLRPLRRLIDTLAGGLGRIGLSRSVYESLGVSLFVLVFQILAFWLMMWAFGLRLSIWAGTVVLLVVHVGTALPNAPANVGTYQFFCVVGLSLFGVDKTPATAFSVVVFVLLTIPLWAIGFWALSTSGTTLACIRSEIRKLRTPAPQG